MTAGAILFMVLSWSFVLGLTAWAFAKVLGNKGPADPDATEPPRPTYTGSETPGGR